MIVLRLPAADLEITEAAEWYDSKLPRLGDDFIQEVENAFDRISCNPLIHAQLEHFAASAEIRRCLLHRFPYLVIYRYRPDEILVVAVSHVRRKPFYWLERLT